jgi:hypothetical protein
MAKPLSKPPAYVLKAYRRDFDAIAAMIVGDGEPLAGMALVTSPMESLRMAFAVHTAKHGDK